MTTHFIIPDMDCGGCVRSIVQAIQKLDASARIEADLDSKNVSVTGHASAETYAKAIEDAGFTVTTAPSSRF